ncbi:FAD-dependent monooxygenase [Rhizobium sp. RCC_161_2]|uniref:FAD-dependent monooxygenase n=1 Tax=Rhizobium sp. RCC_161_2 TaxID=3239219 RepID=UPI003523FF07
MKIAVIGGGPAGLYFASTLKRLDASHAVTVFEKSPRGSTYGFGVAFSAGGLKSIETVGPELGRSIRAASQYLPHLTIVHQGERVVVRGNDFFGVARLRLLELLTERALSSGVDVTHGSNISNNADLAGFDMIVGADGLNSFVRRHESFESKTVPCRNFMIWYGSECPTDGIELIFQKTPFGLMIGHTYRYRPDRNTFVVECTPTTYRTAGLDQMSERESLDFCSSVFSEHLKGSGLRSNRSVWFRPKLVWTPRWACGNVALIGDALKSLHPSIGSGTRAAMKDAFALAQAIHMHQSDFVAALSTYERQHKPIAEELQQTALQSIQWYETIEDKLNLSPIEFAFQYMTRTGKVTLEQLEQMDPSFTASCLAEGLVAVPQAKVLP